MEYLGIVLKRSQNVDKGQMCQKTKPDVSKTDM
jgi:hypothetical protein